MGGGGVSRFHRALWPDEECPATLSLRHPSVPAEVREITLTTLFSNPPPLYLILHWDSLLKLDMSTPSVEPYLEDNCKTTIIGSVKKQTSTRTPWKQARQHFDQTLHLPVRIMPSDPSKHRPEQTSPRITPTVFLHINCLWVNPPVIPSPPPPCL